MAAPRRSASSRRRLHPLGGYQTSTTPHWPVGLLRLRAFTTFREPRVVSRRPGHEPGAGGRLPAGPDLRRRPWAQPPGSPCWSSAASSGGDSPPRWAPPHERNPSSPT